MEVTRRLTIHDWTNKSYLCLFQLAYYDREYLDDNNSSNMKLKVKK